MGAVTGVDIVARERYPFKFVQADAMEYPLDGYDLIWASPPCQRFSDLANRNKNAHEWPDLIAPVRRRLEATTKLWVMENVEGAPLRRDLILCGTMFAGLRVLRHRVFESNFHIGQPIEAGGRYVPTNQGGAVSADGTFAATRLEWLPLADKG